MPRVFLNYRREDSEGIAGRIFDRLSDRFGPENVFRDLDTIGPGAAFASVIGKEIAKCDALIAIIGNDWLEAKDAEGKRRLDNPRDFVRTEIAEALSRKKLIIPTLVEGARMPGAKDLPTEITLLAERDAIEISAARFEHDTERLIKQIAGERQATATSSRWRWISDPNRQRTLGFIGAFIAALAAGGWQLYVHLSADSKPASPTSVSVGEGGIAGNVNTTAEPGGVAVTNTGANTTINIGVTLKEHEERLKRREQELRAELTKTSAADKDRLALLEKELAAATAKRENPEASLADFKATLAEATRALGKFKGELPQDQLKQAQGALANGDTAAAEALFSKALEQGKAQAAASHEKAAEAAYQLAQLAYEHVDYKKAYAYYQEAANLEQDNPTYLNMAGKLAYEVGRYAEAQPFLEKALAIREKALGPEHPDVAANLNNLAELYRTQGRYEKAEPLYQRSLAIREKALGPEHPDVAQSLNNLAELYRTQGRYDKAEPLYQRALAIREKALRPEHPDVAQSLNNLALLYYAQGQYGKAEPLYQRALAIGEKALGPEHPDVATSLNNLALLYKHQGRYGKAEPLYQRALAIFEKALGSEHPDVAQSLNNLALLYKHQGRYGKAEPLYQR
ncbi:MAG: tetratricopeptide repeat protein, partial [Pseudomonadota bacterium]|nr:tetratricopeptide repeat protein [Pseudomonadota bacterium]